VGVFDRFTALSFDCYGTLIDWEAGLVAELRPFADHHGLALADDELLTVFGGLETVVQDEQPRARYPEVLAEALRRIGARYGVAVQEAEAEAFGGSVGRWPAFPDSAEALARLKTRFRLIILSNIDHASFAKSNEHLGVTFDLVITAQDVGAYKPSPRNFRVLLERAGDLGVQPGQLLHVAQSLFHDHEPAKQAGMATVWIDRRHDKPGFGATPAPATDVVPDWRFESLAAFADAVDRY
jgi:2-haloacid dehalogenase